MIAKYQVSGITCEHCVKAIKTEVGAIPAVTEVELDTAGALVVHSESEVSRSQLEAALAEAGDEYALAAV
jgi:copper chaperone